MSWIDISQAQLDTRIIMKWPDGHIESGEMNKYDESETPVHWLDNCEVLGIQPIQFIYIPE